MGLASRCLVPQVRQGEEPMKVSNLSVIRISMPCEVITQEWEGGREQEQGRENR